MYIIVGLGNPEKKYDNTRHNIGFDVIDYLSRRYGIPVDMRKHRSLIGKGIIDGMSVLLVKPQTYMNLSGEAVRAVAEFYNEPVENIVILCDDVYLDTGVLRIRKSGSAGGHNGLKNIILQLATDNFKRIRIGVGKQPEKTDLVDFVLGRFSKAERADMDSACEDAGEAALCIFREGIDRAMNLYNGARKKPEDLK